MLAIGSLFMIGASAACNLNDIIAFLEAGDEGSDDRRRFIPAGAFNGLNPQCVPCAQNCISTIFATAATGGVQNEEQLGEDFYMCLLNCGKPDFNAPCTFGDMMKIQQDGMGQLMSNTDPNFDFKNLFAGLDGIEGQCIDCQTKCTQESLIPALEQLGSILENAFSGNGQQDQQDAGLDFEEALAKFGFCSGCCVGMDMSAQLGLTSGATCQQEFGSTIPEMFLGSSEGSSGGDNTGMIVGIVVAVLLVVALGAGFAWYRCSKAKSPEAEDLATEFNTEGQAPEGEFNSAQV